MPTPLKTRAATEDQKRVFQQRRLAWANSTRQLRQEQASPLVETPVHSGNITTLKSEYSFTGLILAVMRDDPEYSVEWRTTERGARFEYLKDVSNAAARIAQYCGVSPHLVECLEIMSKNGHANRRELNHLLLAVPYLAYEY